MAFPDQLLTDRLLLRPPTVRDAESIFLRYGQDLEVCRFMNWTPHISVEETRAYLQRIVGDNEAGRSAGYLIFSRDSGELLGSIGGRIQDALMQFGYCLARDAWRQGYATEAAYQFVTTALAQPKLWRIQAFCDVENRASARVLEKAGLILEGTLRRYMVMLNVSDVPRDMLCYAKARDASP